MRNETKWNDHDWLLELNLILTLTDLLLATTNQILIVKINLVPVDLGCSGALSFPVTPFNFCALVTI